MKLSSLTLAAALAVAATGAFAQTTIHRTVKVGPNGEVTHVTKRVETPNGTRVVHRVRHVMHTPVVVHRRVVYTHPHYYHHRHVAYVVPHHRPHERVAVVHKEIIHRG